MQDCMEFLNNLLLNNAPNQLMFRYCMISPHNLRLSGMTRCWCKAYNRCLPPWQQH